MNELKIVATIVVKEAFRDDLEKVFRKVVDETRKEAGNISYDLHQDVNNPLKYVIIEVWKGQSAIDFHNQTPHFQELVAATEGHVDSLTIDVLKKVY